MRAEYGLDEDYQCTISSDVCWNFPIDEHRNTALLGVSLKILKAATVIVAKSEIITLEASSSVSILTT